MSDQALAAKAIASVNPNRPQADLAVSLLELRELPELLRDAGRILHGSHHPVKNAAKANLMAQFGALPLISDVGKVLDFVNQVALREQHLLKLKTKGTRFKRTLGSESWQATSTMNPFDPKVDVYAYSKIKIDIAANRKYWYTVRANLLGNWTEREIRSFAVDGVFGLDTISASTLWELLPWSWLIDWFSNTGDILTAYRSGIPWHWSGLNVMYQTGFDVRASFPYLQSGLTVNLKQPEGHAVTKVRRPVAIVWTLPEFSVPYLTGTQWSILGSLATLRL